MSVARVLLAVGAFLFLFAAAPVHADEPAGTERLSEQELVRAALETAVSDPAELALREAAVTREITAIARRLGQGRPGVRRARKLHRLLHRSRLDHFVADADDLYAMLQTGRYNCLSASLFYGLVARRAGYEPTVIKLPGHLLVRVPVRRRSVDIEMTTRIGFDLEYYSSLQPAEAIDTDRVGHRLEWPRTSPLYGASIEPRWQVSLEAAVGYGWINRAWRDLDAGDAPRAARSAARAVAYLGELASEEESIRRLLVRAFRHEYEAGRFDGAFEIAAIDVGLFPERTTSRDRLFAAAVKRVEDFADAGAPAPAMAVLSEVSRLCEARVDLERFQRRTSPLIAAAAVRIGDWEVARRAAAAYAAVEPDPVEGRRLRQWVRSRSQGLPYAFEDSLRQGPGGSEIADRP